MSSRPPPPVHQVWQNLQFKHSSALERAHGKFPTDPGIFLHCPLQLVWSTLATMDALWNMSGSLPVSASLTTLPVETPWSQELCLIHFTCPCDPQVLGPQLRHAEWSGSIVPSAVHNLDVTFSEVDAWMTNVHIRFYQNLVEALMKDRSMDNFP